MKNNLLKIALISSLIAVVVVVALKLLGQSNAVVMGGAIAGGIVGALASSMTKTKED